ncbi:MAG TPA: HPF/RaiA family ribosome-associated protein [Rhizomicrobium sp.]
MDRPLELVFHNMKKNEEVETLVHERMERLEHLYDHIIGCRVSVEVKNDPHRALPEVHVELQVPGQVLVVRHDERHARKLHREPDVLTSVRDAFDALAIQVRDYKARRMGNVKTHAPEPLPE